jgi:peptidyl-prolyl cis-trans isomerase SurA
MQLREKNLSFIKSLSLFIVFYCFSFTIQAQKQKGVIDEVIAVVGAEILTLSEYNSQLEQYKQQGYTVTDAIRCASFEEMIFQKMLLNQSKVDSLKVNDDQVDGEMERRIRYFVGQIGSEAKLEEFYGKRIAELKEDFRDLIRDQMLTQQMQAKAIGEVTITPAEVKSFFKKIPYDSLPRINTEIEIAQIACKPQISGDAKRSAREKILELKDRIKQGGNFAALARIYSEDPGSARKGGELGYVGRGTFVPEFEAAAYSLKEGEISPVIETQFGFHIMELIGRRGDNINVRHILISPKIDAADVAKASLRLDSIYELLKKDTLKFEQLAMKVSEDEETKKNGGLMVNPMTGSTKFEVDQLDKNLFFIVDKLEPGQYSAPFAYTTDDGKTAFRIVKLKSRSAPHVANLKDDYYRIQDAAKAAKEKEIKQKWIKKIASKTYIKINSGFENCTPNWLISETLN